MDEGKRLVWWWERWSVHEEVGSPLVLSSRSSDIGHMLSG